MSANPIKLLRTPRPIDSLEGGEHEAECPWGAIARRSALLRGIGSTEPADTAEPAIVTTPNRARRIYTAGWWWGFVCGAVAVVATVSAVVFALLSIIDPPPTPVVQRPTAVVASMTLH